MSSMTLKQFMTRGMEKDASDYIVTPEGIKYVEEEQGGSNSDSFFRRPLGTYIGKRIAYEASNGSIADPKLYANENATGIMDDLQKTVKYLKPIVFDDEKYAQEIAKIDEVMPGAGAKFKEIGDKIRSIPGLKRLYKTSPGMFDAFADQYIYQNIMKEMGLDPSKVGDYVKDLNSYDMNQHLPGMAAAFGIPFGIGALMGKPGWGLLLGLLGAGGYGYYRYNQMQGQRPEVEDQMLNNAPGTDNTAATSEQANQNNSAPAAKALPKINLPQAGATTQPTVPNNPNASAEEIMNGVFPNTTAVNNTTGGNNALTEYGDDIDVSALDAGDGVDQEMGPKPVTDTPANNTSLATPPTNTQYVQVTPRKAATTPPPVAQVESNNS